MKNTNKQNNQSKLAADVAWTDANHQNSKVSGLTASVWNALAAFKGESLKHFQLAQSVNDLGLVSIGRIE